MIDCLAETFKRRLEAAETSIHVQPKTVLEKRTRVGLQVLDYMMRCDSDHVTCVNSVLNIYKFKVEKDQGDTVDDEEGDLDEDAQARAAETYDDTAAADATTAAVQVEITDYFLVSPDKLYCQRCAGTESCSHIEFIRQRNAIIPTKEAAVKESTPPRSNVVAATTPSSDSPAQLSSPETRKAAEDEVSDLIKQIQEVDLSKKTTQSIIKLKQQLQIHPI